MRAYWYCGGPAAHQVRGPACHHGSREGGPGRRGSCRFRNGQTTPGGNPGVRGTLLQSQASGLLRSNKLRVLAKRHNLLEHPRQLGERCEEEGWGARGGAQRVV